jgi:hypothetical protein
MKKFQLMRVSALSLHYTTQRQEASSTHTFAFFVFVSQHHLCHSLSRSNLKMILLKNGDVRKNARTNDVTLMFLSNLRAKCEYLDRLFEAGEGFEVKKGREEEREGGPP